MKNFYIQTIDDLKQAIDDFGILPFFSNHIPGYSIEENCDPSIYFTDQPGPWDWKGPIIQETRCAYGKFFNKKAAFVKKKFYYDLANYRRDGYDFDARVDEGIATYNEQYLYNIIASHHSILSKDAKAIGGYVKPRTKGPDTWEPRKGFDTLITRLQMQGYILTSDFEYEVSKSGEFYGWGVARYATPEEFFGKTFEKNVYKRSPEDSYKRLFKHMRTILPEASDEEIHKFLKG